MKRWTVFTYPSLYGTPKDFRWYICAWLYMTLRPGQCELHDNKTGKYYNFLGRLFQ